MTSGQAAKLDGGRRWKRVSQAVFVIVVLFFGAFNVYRSATLNQQPSSSHEYLHRHQELQSSPSSRNLHPGSIGVPIASSLGTDVDRLLLVHCVREDDFPPYNVTLDTGQVRPVPLWQRRLSRRPPNSTANAAMEDDIIGPYYFLTELLQVRIYDGDAARWTVNELKQWLHYMLLAGVEHFYICDHFVADSERLDGVLRRYIDAGLVTYLSWDHRSAGAGDPITAQTRCYQRLVTRYRRRHRWQIAVDIDEYPFAPNDTGENFLGRYLDQISDDVSEISMANYLMLGTGDRTHTKMAIERIVRMSSRPANDLVKPVYRPDRLRAAHVHRNRVDGGRRVDAEPDRLRMLHYWGARGQSEDPVGARAIMAKTVEMTSMRDAWSQRVENSLLAFGELNAFSSETGP